MTDFLATLLIMTGVGLLFLFPAAYFGGGTGVTVTAVILTAIGCYLFVFLEALGRAFGNGNSSIRLDWDTLVMFMSLAALFGFLAYGSYCFGQVIKNVEGYKIKLIIWSFILFGYPIYLYASDAYKSYYTQRKNYSSNITIAHPKDFPILIDRIKFFQSNTQKASLIALRYVENHHKVADIEGLPTPYEFKQSQRYYTKSTRTLIPIGFDSFELSWYSVLEDKFYRDVFPIDQKKLDIWEDSEKQMKVSDMLIHILPDGHVDLLTTRYSDRKNIINYFDIGFHEVQGKSLDDIFQSYSQISSLNIHDLENLKKDFDHLMKGTTTNLSPTEILNFRKVYPFGLEIDINQKPNDTNGVEIIDFYLNRYTRKADFLKEINKKPLPSFISIKRLNDKNEGSHIDVILDKKTLFDQYTAFTEKHQEGVYFDLQINVEDFTKSQIWLKSKDNKVALANWIITD